VKTIARKRENKKWKRAVLQSTRGVPRGTGLARDGWEKRGGAGMTGRQRVQVGVTGMSGTA